MRSTAAHFGYCVALHEVIWRKCRQFGNNFKSLLCLPCVRLYFRILQHIQHTRIAFIKSHQTIDCALNDKIKIHCCLRSCVREYTIRTFNMHNEIYRMCYRHVFGSISIVTPCCSHPLSLFVYFMPARLPKVNGAS